MGAYRRAEQGYCKIFPRSYHQSNVNVKPTTEQNPKNIILHCGTSYINDDVELQNITKEITEVAKSIKRDCSSNVTVSGIDPRYGKWDLPIVVSEFTAEIRIFVLLAMRI